MDKVKVKIHLCSLSTVTEEPHLHTLSLGTQQGEKAGICKTRAWVRGGPGGVTVKGKMGKSQGHGHYFQL